MMDDDDDETSSDDVDDYADENDAKLNNGDIQRLYHIIQEFMLILHNMLLS